MMAADGSPGVVSGKLVLLALFGIACATAVIPPAAAWGLNQRRIAETRARGTDAAPAVAARLAMLRDAGQLQAITNAVVCGPGRRPDAPTDRASQTHDAWLADVRMADVRSVPDVLGGVLPADAWGRCFLVNVEAARDGHPVWLISAGPNGVIDTAMTATALAGDDIGVELVIRPQ